jgi:hypothetical protein
VSQFRLQIVDKAGKVTKGWQPGDRVETELVDELCARVKAKGVGLGRTEAHVLADLRLAFAELLYELKARV